MCGFSLYQAQWGFLLLFSLFNYIPFFLIPLEVNQQRAPGEGGQRSWEVTDEWSSIQGSATLPAAPPDLVLDTHMAEQDPLWGLRITANLRLQ